MKIEGDLCVSHHLLPAITIHLKQQNWKCLHICNWQYTEFDITEGIFSLPRFPMIVLFMKSNGTNFAWACLNTLSNRWDKISFPEKSHFPGKQQN